MLCTHHSESPLTAMLINELQASTAITSKKVYSLNTNKLTNIQLAAQLNSQCTAITLLYRRSRRTEALTPSTSPVAL